MRILILSIICTAVIGIIVAVFLQVKKHFDKKYDEFEDERHRAAIGSARDAGKKDDGGSTLPPIP
ncbi:MAG: hypothetical protein ACM3Q4_10970 [Acidobacteriota bacterium]